jgi:hypothetical protein
MENTSGFYKQNEEGSWIYAPNFVYGPDFELIAENHESYTYPVDGWVWYDIAPLEYVRWVEENNDSTIING